MAPVPLLPPDQFHPEIEAQIMEHIFKSKLPDLPLPLHLSLHQYCFQNISQFPHKPAIIDGPSGRQISFEELQISSQKVAAGLSNLGIQQGDVVMLLLPNCIEFALVFLGASMRGAACTTSNPHYTASEIEKQLILSEAKLVVTVSSCIDKIKCENVQILTVDEEIEGYKHISQLTEAPLVPDYPLEDIDPDDVVALPFSSGTTGLPKGVMLTHRSIVVNLAQQVDGDNPTIDMSSRDIILCVLPMFHIYSLSTILLCSIRVGATIVLMQKYEIRTLLDLIQSMKVTIAPLVPPCVLAMTKNPAVLEYDLSSVRMVLCGAAPLGKDVEDAFRERLPNAILSQGYGMTEAGPVLAMSMAFAKHPQPVKSGSCGTVIRNAEIKIIDPETGVSLPYNKSGEICIRSPQIMKGYLNDPKATAATIDRDGWLHTGDVGFIDTDEELFIVDRLKEIIKYKGFQVAPAELEKLLVSHECISDAAVVGRKDPNAGEIPVAFVVKCGALSEEEIKEFIAKQVVFYKRLQSVLFIDSIPKTPAGKILRRELRDQYLN